MDRKLNELLEKISLEEGGSFLADRAAIDAALVKHDKAYSNIIIKILSAIGGVLATLALLGFLLLAGIYQSESGMMILGILMIVAAMGASRVADHVFFDTVLITLYISGFVLAGIGIGSAVDNGDAVILLCLLFSLAGTFFSGGFMMVMISVVIFNGSLFAEFSTRNMSAYSLLFVAVLLSGLGLFWVTIKEPLLLAQGKWLNKLYKPLQSGLFISFLGGLAWMSHSYMLGFFAGINNFRFISIAIDIMVLLMVSKIIVSLGIVNRLHTVCIYVFTVLILAGVFFSPGIAGSLFLLLLSVYYGYKAESGISIVALGYFIVKFYYDLQLSLLMKSGLLFFSGLLLILAWYYVHQQTKKNEAI